MDLKLKIKLASIFIITIALLGCNDPKLSYNKEAKIFCDLHKTENWEGGARRATNAELKVILDRKISEVAFSKKFEEIINDLDKIKFLKKLYSGAQEKIRTLTGEQWECPEYKEFYSVKFERITPKIKPKNNSLTINISSSGEVIVNGELMKNITTEEFNKILTPMKLKSPVSVAITINKGASRVILNQVMQALKNTEVEDLVLIEK